MGDVSAVLFNADYRQRFQLSNIVIGQGIIVVKPQLEGEWRGIQIVHTPEPCLPGDTNWRPFLSSPFPDRVSIFCRLPCLPVIFWRWCIIMYSYFCVYFNYNHKQYCALPVILFCCFFYCYFFMFHIISRVIPVTLLCRYAIHLLLSSSCRRLCDNRWNSSALTVNAQCLSLHSDSPCVYNVSVASSLCIHCALPVILFW